MFTMTFYLKHFLWLLNGLILILKTLAGQVCGKNYLVTMSIRTVPLNENQDFFVQLMAIWEM